MIMLILKILRTFCGGRGSLVTSNGSPTSRACEGAWGAFSLPEALGIFLRVLLDAKWGIGQCRSIASTKLVGHIPENNLEVFRVRKH